MKIHLIIKQNINDYITLNIFIRFAIILANRNHLFLIFLISFHFIYLFVYLFIYLFYLLQNIIQQNIDSFLFTIYSKTFRHQADAPKKSKFLVKNKNQMIVKYLFNPFYGLTCFTR